MHTIEPFYGWRDYYTAETDKQSPFYRQEYSEFECTHQIYNYLIHPQWDFFGSATLFLKILYTDYEKSFTIIELIGEWNDCLYNDIMYLKRNVIEHLCESGIEKFILIGENVLNFHYSDTDYYEEWTEEINDGWIIAINFRQHTVDEFIKSKINNYISFIDDSFSYGWRTFSPDQFYNKIEEEKNN